MRRRASSARFQSTPSVWRETIIKPLVIAARIFQSTPSVWRETAKRCGATREWIISIHSLRVEGDQQRGHRHGIVYHFNPLPPCGGRPQKLTKVKSKVAFQSTPSVWRETPHKVADRLEPFISIHSLRVEGDYLHIGAVTSMQKISIHSLRVEGDQRGGAKTWTKINFNPLPPCGGRPEGIILEGLLESIFQSTPSVWRETVRGTLRDFGAKFQSTPSVWRETLVIRVVQDAKIISIHSLRVEGDRSPLRACRQSNISIHSLRVEGDVFRYGIISCTNISIHSLRVEGDAFRICFCVFLCNFNPLPPCGGRRLPRTIRTKSRRFQSTPSVWRETYSDRAVYAGLEYFNPLPPCGGRR